MIDSGVARSCSQVASGEWRVAVAVRKRNRVAVGFCCFASARPSPLATRHSPLATAYCPFNLRSERLICETGSASRTGGDRAVSALALVPCSGRGRPSQADRKHYWRSSGYSATPTDTVSKGSSGDSGWHCSMAWQTLSAIRQASFKLARGRTAMIRSSSILATTSLARMAPAIRRPTSRTARSAWSRPSRSRIPFSRSTATQMRESGSSVASGLAHQERKNRVQEGRVLDTDGMARCPSPVELVAEFTRLLVREWIALILIRSFLSGHRELQLESIDRAGGLATKRSHSQQSGLGPRRRATRRGEHPKITFALASCANDQLGVFRRVVVNLSGCMPAPAGVSFREGSLPCEFWFASRTHWISLDPVSWAIDSIKAFLTCSGRSQRSKVLAIVCTISSSRAILAPGARPASNRRSRLRGPPQGTVPPGSEAAWFRWAPGWLLIRLIRRLRNDSTRPRSRDRLANHAGNICSGSWIVR